MEGTSQDERKVALVRAMKALHMRNCQTRRGAALVRAMKALHMSNGTLAEMVGVSAHTVTMWRSTGRLPSSFYLRPLASAMVWSDAELGSYVRGGDLYETPAAELEAELNKAHGEWQEMQAELEGEKVRHAKTRAKLAAVLLQAQR